MDWHSAGGQVILLPSHSQDMLHGRGSLGDTPHLSDVLDSGEGRCNVLAVLKVKLCLDDFPILHQGKVALQGRGREGRSLAELPKATPAP